MKGLTAEELRRKVRGAKARKAGDTLEELTLRYLVARGVLAQRIATPCAVVGGRKRYLSKVVGDLVGVGVEGRAVLVECKRRTDGGVPRRPVPSDFQPHQRETLAAWQPGTGPGPSFWCPTSIPPTSSPSNRRRTLSPRKATSEPHDTERNSANAGLYNARDCCGNGSK